MVNYTKGPSEPVIQLTGPKLWLRVTSWKNSKPWHILHFEGRDVHFKLKIKNVGDALIENGGIVCRITKMESDNFKERDMSFRQLGIEKLKKGEEREIVIRIPYDCLMVGSLSISLHPYIDSKEGFHLIPEWIPINSSKHFLKIYPWNFLTVITFLTGGLVTGLIILLVDKLIH